MAKNIIIKNYSQLKGRAGARALLKYTPLVTNQSIESE